MSNNPEQLKSSQDYSIETAKAAGEQLEKLSKIESDKQIENNSESVTENARAEALENALAIGTSEKESKEAEKSSDSWKRGIINKKQRDESYKKTLKLVQDELPPIGRAFSKIIHNNIIEKTSDAVSSTIARPNAILSGAIMAFVLTLITYTVAKTIGYVLSGFETIGAFILGWIIGLVYDYLKVLIAGRK